MRRTTQDANKNQRRGIRFTTRCMRGRGSYVGHFYIDVMGETLGYRVDRITVIEPDDTSQLKIVPGEDRVTLMTCTPYGVNTHRLLVSGVRAAIPGDIPPLEEAPRDPHAAASNAVTVTLLPLLILVVFLRHGPW